MQIQYRITSEKFSFGEDGEVSDPEYGVVEEASDSVVSLARKAVNSYGIDYLREGEVYSGTFRASTPAEDRAYFEEGLYTYYVLHITTPLSDRNSNRFNKLLKHFCSPTF